MAGEVDLLPLRPCTHVLGVDQANGGRAGLLSVATLAARSAAAMHTQREMDRLAALGIATKPTLLLDGTTESFYCDGPGGAVVSSDLRELLAARGGSFTRPLSPARYLGQAGTLLTAPADTPRIEYDSAGARRGLRMEGARTNTIINNGMVGGVSGTPGAAPTGWPEWTFGGELKLTRTFGVEDGIPFLDFRIWGTPPASIGYRLAPQGINAVAVASGESWTVSMFGGFRDLTAAPTNCQLRLLWAAGGDAEVNGPDIPFVPLTNGALKSRRISHTRTAVLPASGSGAIIRIGVTGGVYVDCTFRMGLPQLELGAHASSPILTSTTAVTRAMDDCRINPTGWYSGSQGTWVAEASLDMLDPSTIARIVDVNLNVNNRILVGAIAGGISFVVITDGVHQVNSVYAGIGAGSTFKVAARMLNGDFGLSLNGGAPIKTTGAKIMPPAPSSIGIGVPLSGGKSLDGIIKSIKYFPTALSDAQLQAVTA